MLEELSLEDLVIVKWLYGHNALRKDPGKAISDQWFVFPYNHVKELGFSFHQIHGTLKTLEEQELLFWSTQAKEDVYQAPHDMDHIPLHHRYVLRLMIDGQMMVDSFDLHDTPAQEPFELPSLKTG